LGIQEKLMALGYMAYDEPTDYYGYTTWYSVQLFQRKHDLSIDGIAGDLTLQLLFSDEAKPYTVKLEDTGSDVKEFQDRLKSLNYLKTSSTSYFGTDTEKAVISFQKRNGLSPDGIIGENTLELLYSDSAKEAATSSSSGGGSSGGSTTHASVYIEGDPTPEALIKYAKTKLGCNYSLGAKGPSSFDCSGFVYYCLNQIGYKIKYMTSTGWTNCDLKKISKMKDMKAGDIICFTPHHVGIYMGNGRMIDASSGNDEVVIRDNIFNSSYWTSHFVCARRIF
jgi:cell wall-associated NlpC family hydrolase